MTKEHLIPFKKGQSGNPNGRPPSLTKRIKELPADAQKDIYGILFEAMTYENVTEAVAFLEKDARLGKYGFIKQLTIKSLTGKNGWQTLMDILDRLFGRPKQTNEHSFQNATHIVVRSNEEKEKIENIGELGI